MTIWFWFWLVLAAVLLVLEVFTGGFFMLPFAIGAAASAVLAFLYEESFVWQWVLFVGVSAVLLVVFRRLAHSVTVEPPERVGVDRVLGKTGIVVEELDPHSSVGRVRIDTEEWRAETADGTSLAIGECVTVSRIEGTRLIVTPVCEDETSATEAKREE